MIFISPTLQTSEKTKLTVLENIVFGLAQWQCLVNIPKALNSFPVLQYVCVCVCVCVCVYNVV
jgi:hypothetical protein